MSAPTPLEILAPLSDDQLRSLLIAYLQADQDPVTDFESGGSRRTQLEYVRLGLQDLLAKVVPSLAGAGNFATVSDDDWADLIAEQRFNTARVAARMTQQIYKLTSTLADPLTIGVGQVLVTSPNTGNRYRNITGGSLPAGGTLVITVQAEGPNDTPNGIDYNDVAGSLTTFINPIPGVTGSNLAPAFSGVTSTPSPALGLGVVTVTGTPPAAPTAYDFLITSSGQNTTAKFQWRANGGNWSSPVTMVAAYTIPTTSVVVHFANDAGGANPSFRAGDLYSFTAPGSPITQLGTDRESTAALIARCLAMWPSLAAGAVEDKRVKWAKAGSASVKRVRVLKDATYPGRVKVAIAGAPGTSTLSGGIVTAVQLYIDRLEGAGDLSLVAAATAVTVIAGGAVEVPAGTLAFVQSRAEVAWVAYVNNTDIGGVIRIAELLQLLMDAGASDVFGLNINSVFSNLVLGATEVAIASPFTGAISWLEV